MARRGKESVTLDAAYLANDGRSRKEAVFLISTMPHLRKTRLVVVEAYQHGANGNDDSLNRVCSTICKQATKLPLLEKLEFRWGYTSLQSLQAFRSLLPNCREICFSFALKDDQRRLYEVAAMHYLLPACNVKVLQFDQSSVFVRSPEDIQKLAVSLSTYCPRLKTLRFTNHHWENPLQISGAFLALVNTCASLRALEIGDTNKDCTLVYSTKIAIELAKRRLHYDELVQNQISMALLPVILSKQMGECTKDIIAKRTVLFRFLQRANPLLFPT